jgi:FSR family fosmidomycin resistance protein-like MFS transporter
MNLKIILILSLSHICIDLTGTAIPAMMPLFKDALNLSYTAVGAVIMVSALTSSIIQPCFGYLSDIVPMKWVLPVSFFVTFVGFSFSGLATSYPALVILVFVSGIGVASYHPEGMKVMHFFSGSRRVAGMSFFQIGGNLGLALGPLFISYAMQFAGLSGTLFFLLAGLPMLVALMLFNKEFSSPLQQEERAFPEKGKSTVHHSPEPRDRWSSLWLLVFAVSLRSWAHMGLISYVPFYFIQVLNGDAVAAGKMVFVFLMGGVVGTLIGAVLADKVGHKYYFLLSMIFSVPLLFIFLRVTVFWTPLILFLIGLTLISSFSVTIVMGQRLLPDRLGMASGIMTGLVIGMGGIGAGLLGFVADGWGISTVLNLIAYMPAVGSIPILLISYPPLKPQEISTNRINTDARGTNRPV